MEDPMLRESAAGRVRAALRIAASAAFCLLLSALWAASLYARTADEALAEGDAAYAQAHLADARGAYQAAVTAAPGSLNALCRLVRAESELGETQSGDEQRRTWSAAVEHARAAVKLAPDSSASHVWLAAALGRQAMREGPKAKLALSREIKSEADRALALDANNARAWHVLAVWNVKVSGLSMIERMAANAVLGGVPKGASFENAEHAFQKAIALEPAYVHHRLEYGRMLKDQKREADARREFEKAIALPATSDALDARYQFEARELLKKLPKS
jgi:tetratricopeptide (TPR) repeat protein